MKNTEQTYIKNCIVNLLVIDSFVEYHKNNEYTKYSERDIVEMYDLTPFEYAHHLDGLDIGELNSFNTFNHGAPIVFQGCYNENLDFAFIEMHLGGDVRGNYSRIYYTDNADTIHSLLSQSTELYIELSDGREFTLYCDNVEAYFDLNNIDPYWIDFDEALTTEQLETIEDEMEEL